MCNEETADHWLAAARRKRRRNDLEAAPARDRRESRKGWLDC
ncbi:hypothetical protein BURMUCGD1_3789 [Burkholderia multivorans CGD1]|nr:hypothetical protein BURMUCGD1_3789 [Burkholderia multivorans CGD1]